MESVFFAPVFGEKSVCSTKQASPEYASFASAFREEVAIDSCELSLPLRSHVHPFVFMLSVSALSTGISRVEQRFGMCRMHLPRGRPENGSASFPGNIRQHACNNAGYNPCNMWFCLAQERILSRLINYKRINLFRIAREFAPEPRKTTCCMDCSLDCCMHVA